MTIFRAYEYADCFKEIGILFSDACPSFIKFLKLPIFTASPRIRHFLGPFRGVCYLWRLLYRFLVLRLLIWLKNWLVSYCLCFGR